MATNTCRRSGSRRFSPPSRARAKQVTNQRGRLLSRPPDRHGMLFVSSAARGCETRRPGTAIFRLAGERRTVRCTRKSVRATRLPTSSLVPERPGRRQLLYYVDDLPVLLEAAGL